MRIKPDETTSMTPVPETSPAPDGLTIISPEGRALRLQQGMEGALGTAIGGAEVLPDGRVAVSVEAVEALLDRIQTLELGIEQHRDAKGHERCWEDDLVLYRLLRGEAPVDLTLPPRDEFLGRCAAYYERRRCGVPLGSPTEDVG